MSIQKRLNKIEEAIRMKKEKETPMLITVYEDDNIEEILKSLSAKYGEDYEPRIILKTPKTREEARKERIKYCLL